MPNLQLAANCPNYDNYSPCECYRDESIKNELNRSRINCEKVTTNEIHSLFAKYQPANWIELRIELNNADGSDLISIPENFLANHVVDDRIYIKCLNINETSKMMLEIHPNAFGFHNIELFSISNCNMSFTTNYSFMRGFYRLSTLSISNSPNMDLEDQWIKLFLMPPESNNSTGVNNETISNKTRFAELGLQKLSLTNSKMSESTVRCILRGLLNFSADTLTSLKVEGNKLRAIPEEIKFFKSILELCVSSLPLGYGISVITTGSLQHPSIDRIVEWDEINLYDIRLQHIEPGAFTGLYTITYLSKPICIHFPFFFKHRRTKKIFELNCFFF